MRKNDELVVEVCNLNEVGYPLAHSQRELTTIQKLFLLYAYPRYHEMGDDGTSGKDSEVVSAWEERYRRRVEEKKYGKRN